MMTITFKPPLPPRKPPSSLPLFTICMDSHTRHQVIEFILPEIMLDTSTNPLHLIIAHAYVPFILPSAYPKSYSSLHVCPFHQTTILAQLKHIIGPSPDQIIFKNIWFTLPSLFLGQCNSPLLSLGRMNWRVKDFFGQCLKYAYVRGVPSCASIIVVRKICPASSLVQGGWGKLDTQL